MFQKEEARLGNETGFEGNYHYRAADSGRRDAALTKQFIIERFVPAPSRGPFFWRNWMPKWRSEYRRCDNCRSEYRPKREAQSYCSRDCRRAAPYGRERFKAGRTVGRRK